MFYTIVSRTIITKINTPRDYFYIFLIGSIGYVVLHWYLHMEKRDGIIEKIREYLYYAMVLDVITAYLLMTFYPVKQDKKNNDDITQKQTEPEYEPQYTAEQKRAIMQRSQEARRLQYQRQKELEEQRGKEGHKPPINTSLNNTGEYKDDLSQTQQDKKNEEKSESDIKKSIFTKSDDSEENLEVNDDNDDNKKDTKENTKERSDTKKLEKTSSNNKTNDTPNEKIKIKGKKEEVIVDTDIPVYEGQKKKNKNK